MSDINPVRALEQIIQQLRADRAKHEAAIKHIDEVASRYGISLGSEAPKGKPGRKPKSLLSGMSAAGGAPAPKKRRGRGRREQTGEQFVLEFLAKNGPVPARVVNDAWKLDGRGGSANNMLTKLCQENRASRREVEGERGGLYSIVAS